MASGQRDSCWNEWSGRYDPSITRHHYSGGVQSSDGRGSGFVWNGSRIRTQAGKTFGILIVTGGRSDAAITRVNTDRWPPHERDTQIDHKNFRLFAAFQPRTAHNGNSAAHSLVDRVVHEFVIRHHTRRVEYRLLNVKTYRTACLCSVSTIA